MNSLSESLAEALASWSSDLEADSRAAWTQVVEGAPRGTREGVWSWIGDALSAWAEEADRTADSSQVLGDLGAATDLSEGSLCGGALIEATGDFDRLIAEHNSNVLEALQAETLALEPHQFSRVTKVLAGWTRFSDEAAIGPLFYEEPGRPLVPLDRYLQVAHLHPAIARERGGVRAWFRRWRYLVVRALQEGVDAAGVVAAVHSGRAVATSDASRPASRAPSALKAWVRQHLDHVIQPGAPCGHPCAA